MTTHEDLELLRTIADRSAEGTAVPVDTLTHVERDQIDARLGRLEAAGLIEPVQADDRELVRVTADGLLVLNPQNSL